MLRRNRRHCSGDGCGTCTLSSSVRHRGHQPVFAGCYDCNALLCTAAHLPPHARRVVLGYVVIRSAILDAVGDRAVKKAIDDQYDRGEEVAFIDEQVGGLVAWLVCHTHHLTLCTSHEQTKIDHALYKRLLFVSARDFCMVTHWRVLPDGTLIIAAVSIEDDRCPVMRGVERATTILGGWIIKPQGPEGLSSHCTYMVNTDLGVSGGGGGLRGALGCLGCSRRLTACATSHQGSIPTMVVKKVTSAQPLLVANISDVRTLA